MSNCRMLFHRCFDDNWHSKIYLKVDKGKPIIGIIGSSNLSQNTYLESDKANWNHECDVLIWDNEKLKDLEGIKLDEERNENLEKDIDRIRLNLSVINVQSQVGEKDLLDNLYKLLKYCIYDNGCRYWARTYIGSNNIQLNRWFESYPYDEIGQKIGKKLEEKDSKIINKWLYEWNFDGDLILEYIDIYKIIFDKTDFYAMNKVLEKCKEIFNKDKKSQRLRIFYG